MPGINDIIQQEVSLEENNKYEIGITPFGKYQYKMYEKRFDNQGNETLSRFRIINHVDEYYEFRDNYEQTQ